MAVIDDEVKKKLQELLGSDEGKKKLGERLGIAIWTNRLLIGRVRSFFPVQQVPGPCPEIEAAIRFHHEHPIARTVGWDANGSPTEEWP